MSVGTVTKKFPMIPFGHRQHLHTGHCQFIHGHSLEVQLVFAAADYDYRGFIIDFGSMDYPKELFKSMDHAFIISMSDDRLTPRIMNNDVAFKGLFKPIILPSSSMEGIAWWLYTLIAQWCQDASDGRVFLKEIILTEDGKNTVTFDSADANGFSQVLQRLYPREVWGTKISEFERLMFESVIKYIGKRGAYLNG